MTLFELVKQNICVPDAAEHYGLQVNRNGMCSCPFHEDQHPSMKLNERYFYCFGCGATGDVIDLVARLFDLSSFEAAQKLAQDFGIGPDKPPAATALPKPERPLLKAYRQEEVRCLRVLCDYLHLLERWKVQHAPKRPKDILLCVDDDMRMEALRQTNYVKSIVTAQGKMDLERKGKQSYQGWMCARLLAFSNGDLQALFDRSDGFYRRQLVLTTKEKPAGRVDDPDLAEKMKAEVEGILLWAFEGLQRLAANNFKFTESDRTRENREAVKRDNNNVYDFLDSDGYVRRKADLSASSKELYEAYQIYCTENNLPALKPRSFSEALIACQSRYNLEYCNNVTNAAGRRVRGFLGIEVLVRNHISVFSGDSMRTYVPEDVPEEWRR